VTGIDVLHTAAAVTLALILIRGIQAILEHMAPNSGLVTAGRFVWGGPN
jgi:hypothetical protein